MFLGSIASPRVRPGNLAVCGTANQGRTPDRCSRPKRTPLLVMDFQSGVLQRMSEPEPLLARVRRPIADVRDHGGTITAALRGLLSP